MVGDVTIENSIEITNSLDGRAQDELEQEEEELLTSGIDDPVQSVEEPMHDAPLNQFSDDDLEDEELLTAGLDDRIPSQVDVDGHVLMVNKPALVENYDDDSIDDENLLSD